MIEKLKVVMKPEDWKLPVNELEMRCLKNLLLKVDELVDVVNKQQDIIRQIGEWGSEKGECLWCENITAFDNNDLYAEQKRWIGKICRFWYDNPNDTLLDYLDKIQMGKNGIEYYSKESGDWFPNCEPVLPTDNAIYKGGDNDSPAN